MEDADVVADNRSCKFRFQELRCRQRHPDIKFTTDFGPSERFFGRSVEIIKKQKLFIKPIPTITIQYTPVKYK
jgi:hypothetical protein